VAVSTAVELPTAAGAAAAYANETHTLFHCYARLQPTPEHVSITPERLSPIGQHSTAVELAYSYGHTLPTVYLDLVLLQARSDLALLYFANVAAPFEHTVEGRVITALDERINSG
jgi:hypothetical protein